MSGLRISSNTIGVAALAITNNEIINTKKRFVAVEIDIRHKCYSATVDDYCKVYLEREGYLNDGKEKKESSLEKNSTRLCIGITGASVFVL